MNRWWIVVFAVFFWMAGDFSSCGGAEKKSENPPIHIQSDTMEAFSQQKLVIFSGHAIAVRGEVVLKGDRILVYYKSAENSKDKEGEVDRIEVQGNVIVTQGERTAQGKHAVYRQGIGEITLTGDATLREGRNVVKGDKVTWNLEGKRGVVEGEEGRRVTATIFPKEEESKKK